MFCLCWGRRGALHVHGGRRMQWLWRSGAQRHTASSGCEREPVAACAAAAQACRRTCPRHPVPSIYPAHPSPAPSLRRDILDISSPLNDAGAAVVDDSFLRCFKTLADEPWNWNVYLYPLWAVGVVVRNCILFPLRWVGLCGYSG